VVAGAGRRVAGTVAVGVLPLPAMGDRLRPRNPEIDETDLATRVRETIFDHGRGL
jgi:hypothetical protein